MSVGVRVLQLLVESTADSQLQMLGIAFSTEYSKRFEVGFYCTVSPNLVGVVANL